MNKFSKNDQIVGGSPVESAGSGVMVSASSRTLTEFEIQSIDLFVRIAHMVGIPKSVGEIYGLLFTSPEPLSFDDIVGSLNMSRGSASQGLRLLRMIGAAKSTYMPGERRDYFLAEIELRKLVTGFLNEQVRPHLATGEERLAVLSGLAAGEPESRRRVLVDRVRKLESWISTTAAALPVVVGLLGKTETVNIDGARPPTSDLRPMEELIIKAGRTERLYWRDLWKYRELFYFLAWRDILVRYKQTVVGVAWSLIRPFLTMIVLTVVFGKIGKMPSGGVPYALLVLAGMLPWQFFSNALADSGNSLVTNEKLISKIYFPRMIIPASSVITSFVDFLITTLFLAGVMLWYHFIPPATIMLLPLFVVLAFAASFGVGLWIAALMVEYRDFRFIVPFVVQFGLYASPVAYLSSAVTERYGENCRLLYSLNPIVGVIDGFRWCILGGQNALYWPGLIMSALGTGLLLATGIWYFRKTERTFADVI